MRPEIGAELSTFLPVEAVKTVGVTRINNNINMVVS